MIEMSLNGSPIRDICRVLRVSSRNGNPANQTAGSSSQTSQCIALNQIAPESVEVEILRLKSDGELTATEAELDEC